MTNNCHKEIQLWVQVMCILLAGALVSVCLYLFIQDKNVERYTVTFAYGDGTIIEQKTVRSGKGTIPPDFKTNYVFRGWDKTINSISSDTEVHPMLYSIVENNLFYFDSVYVREGRTFSIDLMLAGNVDISNGKLTLEYDEEVLGYKSYDGGDLVKVEQDSPGKLIVHFSSEDVLKEKMKLAQIKFYAKRKDVEYSQITLSAKEVGLILDGEKIPAECATINNNIYFLQEVG